jgi:hypothetical protein
MMATAKSGRWVLSAKQAPAGGAGGLPTRGEAGSGQPAGAAEGDRTGLQGAGTSRPRPSHC